MVAALNAISSFFNRPVDGIESVGGRAAAPRTQKVEGVENTGYNPFAAISKINCEVTPDVTGGGFTNGVGHFASTKNWMF